MSSQNLSTFAPYSPPPDESKTYRASPIRYSPVSSGSGSGSNAHAASASTSAAAASSSTSTAPFTGVYQATGLSPSNQIKVNTYETDLPIRVDFAAALTYILGCITEQKNDYVRFHAWQSCILFGTLFFFHFIINFLSLVVGFLLLLVELGLIGFLAYRAYIDGATLDRYEVPFFGPLASSWVDNE
ncbi:6846_t:CDS:2 [Ambispora leptoticha]|uniref:6846_t:CDS:1 n=1 Tax=Ambispora leptoticha TaxID=144679 RepID=A0A9N9F3Q2_9GLOM|nr:6846_t:CDS:2 [Ambispora leptoticha]